MNHATEEQLVLYHYGDAGDGMEAASVEEHLHACATCRAVLDEVRRTLAAVESLPVPERPDHYGAEVWARVQPSLGRGAASWRERVQRLISPGTLALAGGTAVLVVAAFVAGRYLPWQRPAPTSVSAPAASQGTAAAPSAASAGAAQQTAPAERELVRERILLVAVGDHLERSQLALVELVNNPGGQTVDISGEQDRARDLVTENRLFRQTALTTGDRAVASVLDELERVLVEVANSPSTMTGAEFDTVRKRIERQGIIFKVRVFGERVREREVSSASNAGIRG